MGANSKRKDDILHELLGGRVVGGSLSQLANYSDLFQRMSEAVLLVDRNSLRVLECNPAALSLFKCNETEILGVELPSLFSTDHSKEQDKSINAVLEKTLKKFSRKSDFQFQSEIDYREGRIFEIYATSLKILDYVEVIQFIAKDVTEIRRARSELQEMNEALKNLSTTDEMTGLRNYRYLKEVLASVHHQAISFKHEYGVIFVDVDHFKKYNDRNGHPAGDEVLRKVAAILKSSSRANDLPCRYGGEEFVILCRNSSLDDTMALAERVRLAIEKCDFPFGEFQPLKRLTASIGVAAFPSCGATWEEVLKNADEALYASKEGGRNRVSRYLVIDKTIKKVDKKSA